MRISRWSSGLVLLAFLMAALAPSGLVRAAPGDLNCDGVLNINDVEPFVLALVDPVGYAAAYPSCDVHQADMNGDGAEDGLDIQAFVNWLTLTAPPVATQLAGNAFAQFPFFEYVRTFNQNASVGAAIDPNVFPDVVGLTCDVYVVLAKTDADWATDPSLVDVRTGGPQLKSFVAGTLQDNTFVLAGPNELNGDAGIGLGIGYDVVFDFNQNGFLDSGDYIDGLGREAGFYVVDDVTQAGPLAVTEIIYSGGSWLGQDTYYPTNIASMGQLPLIVISHGNGHNYQWYDHLGLHLASYGYIVMAHENNTGPGIETASTTTLTNTDYIIGHQATINGGVLNGHIDSHRILWIGHSRGAEGITRAYDRIIDGTYTPQHFTASDILLLSSMLPTDFLKTANSNPHEANYHLWTASADADVDGSAGCDLCQTFHLHDRATRFRHSTVVQGAGHGDFHNYAPAGEVATGPCLIGRANTHLIMKGMFLPLAKHYLEGNIPAVDFFWRQYEPFHPIGAPTGTCIVVTNTYHNGAATGHFVIDDFQTQNATGTSSSGGAVTYTVTNLTEARLDDNNSSFSWTTSDPMNGMTHASSEGSDDSRGVVFDWSNADLYYEQAVVPEARDFTQFDYLSFRACQGTQHPNTTAVLGDLTFSVTLRDGAGTTASINIGGAGGGIEEPYQRSSGWHNEFETIRLRLTDFLRNGTGLDLTDVAAVRFNFGPSWGNSRGRLGMDDIELTNDSPPNVSLNISVVGGAPVLLPPGDSVVLDVDIFTMNETLAPGTPAVHYRYDDGDFITEPLVFVEGIRYRATLPGLSCGQNPELYFSAEGAEIGYVTEPAGAPDNTFQPSVGQYVTFYESLLNTSPGWATTGLWAFGQPTGGGGEYGGPDPTSGYSGRHVYGYNLSGDYENDLPERYLTSGAIDCSGRTQVHLTFWRWLGVEQPLYDHAYVRVSTNGSTWYTVWENDTTIEDTSWGFQDLDISQYADNQSTVYLRWVMGETDGGWHYCGWNIDDLRLTAFVCE